MTNRARARRPIAAALAGAVALGATACGSAPPPRPPAAVSAPVEALQLGMRMRADDDYGGAAQMFGKALELYRSVDDGPGQVTALIDLADAWLLLGETARAGEAIAQARRLAARDGLVALAGPIDLLDAQARAQAGHAEESATLLEALLDRAGTAPALRQAAVLERARLAVENGDGAQDWLARAHAAVSAQDGPTVRARLLRLDAAAARRGGDAARAQDLLEQALALYRAGPYRPGIAATNEELGALAAAGGDAPRAEERYGRALDVRLWLRDRVHAAADTDALVTLAEARGDKPRAAALRAQLAQRFGSGSN